MGLFDRMFGKGAGDADEQQEKFTTLRDKYQTVLNVLEQKNVRVQNLHVQDGKLYITGTASSEEIKNEVWDQIKLVDENYGDLVADISVDADLRMSSDKSDIYVVVPGDTLSEIARRYYGDPNEYMPIFYANQDKLSDPNEIEVGQELVVPQL